MPILLLGSSVFQLRRYADTATLPQSQDRTPRVRFRPLSGFIFFPTGWKCQPEGEDIGSGCCGGGVIQLRLREMAKTIAAGPELASVPDSLPCLNNALSRDLCCITPPPQLPEPISSPSG